MIELMITFIKDVDSMILGPMIWEIVIELTIVMETLHQETILQVENLTLRAIEGPNMIEVGRQLLIFTLSKKIWIEKLGIEIRRDMRDQMYLIMNQELMICLCKAQLFLQKMWIFINKAI